MSKAPTGAVVAVDNSASAAKVGYMDRKEPPGKHSFQKEVFQKVVDTVLTHIYTYMCKNVVPGR